MRDFNFNTMSKLIVCAFSAQDWQLTGTILFLMTVSSVFREGSKDLNCVSGYGGKAAVCTLLQNAGYNYKLNIH